MQEEFMRWSAIGLVLALAACATSEPDPPATANIAAGSPPPEDAIVNASGAEIGKAQFTASPHGVVIRVLVEPGGLTPGWHASHLHAVGDCADTSKFESAGDHVGKAAYHGLLHAHGPDKGDLPNISVAGDGSASVELQTSFTSLTELQDADGSALIIHANPDDHISQPLGGSGDRVACAIVPK
jgi:superoxide dismutase, Cu-Zn family